MAPLDRFYKARSSNGLIPGVLDEDGKGVMEPVPEGESEKARLASFRPTILSWVEWDFYETTGDSSRMERVLPLLAGNMNAVIKGRSRKDGGMWATGEETGMPDLPRVGLHACIDTTAQGALDCEFLALMAIHLDRMGAAGKFSARYLELKELINTHFWDKGIGAYSDRDKDGDSLGILHLGSFWALLANVATRPRAIEMITHLGEFRCFKRRWGLPAMAAGMKGFMSRGGSWAGAVVPPLVYMVVRALERVGEPAIAHEISRIHLEHLERVYRETGCFWERYAPDVAAPGDGSPQMEPGWSALGPIALLVEFLLGVRINVPGGEIIWRLFLDEDHGIRNLRFGEGMVNLDATFRKGKWTIEAKSTVPLDLVVMGPASTRLVELDGKGSEHLEFRG